MEFLSSFLPLLLYFLLIILVIVGIILGLKAINILEKVDKIANDVQGKIESLNGIFKIFDFTTDKIVSISNSVVEFLTKFGIRLFGKKKKKKELESEEE